MLYEIIVLSVLGFSLFGVSLILLDAIYLKKIKTEKLRKRRYFIVTILFVILSIMYNFYSKNTLLSYIYVLIFTTLILFYTVKLVKNNKIGNNVNYLNLYDSCLFGIGVYFFIGMVLIFIEKLNLFSFHKYIIEISLLVLIIEIISIRMLHNEIIKEKYKKEMNIILGIITLIYILYVMFVNPDYMYIKYTVSVFFVVLTIIINCEKISEAVQFILLFITIIIGVFITNYIYTLQLESEVISTSVENIYVNKNINEILNYDIGDRFIFYDEDKIKKNEQLIIYIVCDENGDKTIKESKVIVDYTHEKNDIQGKSWYLEETNEKIMDINNNLKRNKKSYSTYTYYYLYCD